MQLAQLNEYKNNRERIGLSWELSVEAFINEKRISNLSDETINWYSETISYRHEKDQFYANHIRNFYGAENTIIDRSLPEEINSDNNEYILSIIRTKHLKDSTVTIVLIGEDTWSRKWVDWEIYSSLRPYGERTVNGLLGVLLPTARIAPKRFSDNFKLLEIGGTRLQLGYARLVEWEKIAPPIKLPFMKDIDYYNLVSRRKVELSKWIEQAFDNRANFNLINNTSLRFKNNKPVFH